MDKTTFAANVLRRLGINPSPNSLRAFVGWMNAEGGHWNNDAKYNPLNTTQSEPGAGNTGTQGNIKVYKSWQQGIQATVTTLKNGRYGGIIHALKSGDPHAVANAIGSSPWGTTGSTIAGAIAAVPGNLHASAGPDPSQVGPTRGSSAQAGGATYRTIPGKSLLPERQALATSFLGQRGSSANQNLAFAQQIAGLQDQPDQRVRVGATSSPGGSPTGGQNLPSTSNFAKSHSPLLEEIFNGPGSNDFAVKNGQKVSPDIYAAVWDQHTNHVHVAAGPKTVVELGNLAQKMGLHVGENPHFGGVTRGAHVANSYHYKGEAIDVSGSTKQMESFAKEVAKLYRL